MNKGHIWFKAKHTHAFSTNSHLDGRWVEGYYAGEDYINSPDIGELFINKNTLCQSTGLSAYWTDSNDNLVDKSVWTHDLLEIKYDGKPIIAEVVFDYHCGMFILYSEEFPDNYIPLHEVIEMDDTAWIVAKHLGNAFDNPEIIHQMCETWKTLEERDLE